MSKASAEKFLRNNPDFVKKWCVENVGQKDLEAWLAEAESKPGSSTGRLGGDRGSFGRASFTTTNFRDLLESKKNHKAERINKERLLSMSERDVFLELVKNVATELDVNVLCHKILLNVSILTKSDKGSLFLSRIVKNNKFLVSKLFDVMENSTLEDCLHTEETEIRIPFGKGIAGTVAQTKQAINIKNAYEDPRFNKEVDKKTGYRTQSLLCMPIIDYNGELIGVAQIMNKTDGSTAFSQQDEELFQAYLSFCGIGLSNAQLFEMSVQEFKRNQMLLSLAQNIFSEQTNLDVLVTKIMMEGQDVMKCERSSIFLLDPSTDSGECMPFISNGLFTNLPQQYKNYVALLNTSQDKDLVQRHTEAISQLKKSPEKTEIEFSKAFELHEENKGSIITPGVHELQHAKNAELAREVVSTGKVLNIMDCVSDPRFGKEIINHDGFRIRSILSVPINNAKKEVIGVVQFMNKLNGKPFTESDANIVQAFAIFCGLGVHNCQMYENVCIMMAKQTVALEVLSYHATAPQEETDKLKAAIVPSSKEIQLASFAFDDEYLSDDETCQATLRMFIDIGVVSEYHVPYEVLCRWILSVKKNYRPVTYHNWRHALNVAQTMFAMIFEGKMKIHMDVLEQFALIVACLCHDLDHRGTNNTFQSKSESPLAQLYGTSTMEHHHFDQCIMILSSEGNNIFQRLTSDQYRRVIKIVESSILSTDLALYFRKKGSFQKLVEAGNTDWSLDANKELMRGMMMTACDVSAITKPWEVQYRVAHLVAAEFFEQGDMERDHLNEEPIAMMDRKKKDELPKMQVGFIDAICIPVYKLLYDAFPTLKPMYMGCRANRDKWIKQAEMVEKRLKKEISKKGKVESAKMKKEAQEEKKATKKYQVDGDENNANGSNRVIPPKASKSKTCIIL